MTVNEIRERYGLDDDFTDEDVQDIHDQIQVGDIEFEGMNCNDWIGEDEEECTGWDGLSRRCECGNRRVSWIKEYGIVYAVAY